MPLARGLAEMIGRIWRNPGVEWPGGSLLRRIREPLRGFLLQQDEPPPRREMKMDGPLLVVEELTVIGSPDNRLWSTDLWRGILQFPLSI